jgi:hypothetical protein
MGVSFHIEPRTPRLLLELNDSVDATGSYRQTTQTMFRTLGFATRRARN